MIRRFEKFNKTTLLRVIVFVMVLFLALNFLSYLLSRDLYDAAVNEQDGRISLLTRDYDILTYDVSGRLLYSTKLIGSDGGYAHLDYIDGLLYVWTLRTQRLYVYDMSGEIIQESTYEDLNQEWDNWERGWKSLTFTTETHIYKYNEPSFWWFLINQNEAFTLEVIDKESQTSVTIWSKNQN